MEVPPELMLSNWLGYDDMWSADLHTYGSMTLASCHNPIHIPIPPTPPSLLDSILQSEQRLRMELAEESRRNAAVFLQMLEANAASSMREKEVKLEWARKRNRELQARLIKTEVASRTWQKVAKEKEATIAKLSSVLERVGGDAESTVAEEEEMLLNETKILCRVCHGQSSSSVVLLPCRHLCSCHLCEPALVYCPVCQTRKRGSLNVFLGP